MDSLNEYRRIIRDVISRYAAILPSSADIENEVVFDESSDHYELIRIGWNGLRRVHGTVLHLDIRDDKVWIQHDGTEEGVAEELVQAGIPRNRIVLGFKPPSVRPDTDYAVA